MHKIPPSLIFNIIFKGCDHLINKIYKLSLSTKIEYLRIFGNKLPRRIVPLHYTFRVVFEIVRRSSNFFQVFDVLFDGFKILESFLKDDVFVHIPRDILSQLHPKFLCCLVVAVSPE
ncbi:hypothetical protein P279_17210 [Rhodobacteraceae bacterium PD-2]|nr:hypothetical protein P279_17210 [Rhodobacteraceae bacterium PD-2]